MGEGIRLQTRGGDNCELEGLADAREAVASHKLTQRPVAPVPVIKHHALPGLVRHQRHLHTTQMQQSAGHQLTQQN